MKLLLKSAVALALLVALLPLAQATVEVQLVHPEKFSDGLDRWDSQRDELMKGLAAHLQATAAKVVPAAQTLKIEVLDLNLAGEMKPFGPSHEMVRVMNQVSVPSMQVHYVLSQGDQVLREGSDRLVDLDYLNRFNRYWENDSLRFDKPMVDDWVAKEFGRPAK